MLPSVPQEDTHSLSMNPAQSGTAPFEAPLDLDTMLNDILQEGSVPGKSMSTNDHANFPAFSNAFSAGTPFLTSPLLGDFDLSSPLYGALPGNFTSPDMPGASEFTSPFFQDASDFAVTPMLGHDNGANFNDVPLFDSNDGTPPLINDSSPFMYDSNSSPQLHTPLNAVGAFDAGFLDGPSLFSASFDNAAFLGSIQPQATQLSPKEAPTNVQPVVEQSAAVPAQQEPVVKPRRTQNRKVIATGTRRNLKPESLLPEDAPTQSRKYTAPSVTSRKEIPVTFARKRAAAALLNEEEIVPDLPPNASEQEQIEWKRRINTLAARKSRKRKLESSIQLQDDLERYKRERDLWKVRAMTLRGVLKAKGEDNGLDWDDEPES